MNSQLSICKWGGFFLNIKFRPWSQTLGPPSLQQEASPHITSDSSRTGFIVGSFFSLCRFLQILPLLCVDQKMCFFFFFFLAEASLSFCRLLTTKKKVGTQMPDFFFPLCKAERRGRKSPVSATKAERESKDHCRPSSVPLPPPPTV